MARTEIALRGPARDALLVLGQHIREARVQRGWTQRQLASVIAASERTVSLIERGDAAISIGHAFNAASAVGVPLFQIEDPQELAELRHRGEVILGLLPKRVVKQKEVPRELRDF
ncbi:MAG: helix-turn-helix transcriptional regulator [Microbacteriaceae bacterium]|nr:helix-turn-helix transcriptional regulator [Microbacteriaceae bacterium]